MGHSPSIKELAEKESEFREYLKKIRVELESDTRKASSSLETEIGEYYQQGNWDDAKPFIQGENIDVQVQSSWSLDNVGKILEAIGKALFGSGLVPEGIKVEKTPDVTEAMKKMENLEVLAISKAFEAIQGIIQAFSVAAQMEFKVQKKVTQIAPGLTLFLYIGSNSYQSTSFFKNEQIFQYVFIYRVLFSSKQSGDIAKFNAISAYQESLAAYQKRIEDLSRIIADPTTSFESVIQLDKQQEFYTKKIDLIMDQIRKLQKTNALEIRTKTANLVAQRMIAVNKKAS